MGRAETYRPGDLRAARHLLFQQRQEQFAFAAEVGVDRALGEAGMGGDVIEGGRMETVSGEDYQGGIEEPPSYVPRPSLDGGSLGLPGHDVGPLPLAGAWSQDTSEYSIPIGTEYVNASAEKMMARIPNLDRSQLSAGDQQALAALPDLALFRMLAHAPTVIGPWLALG